jgi:WD40 repeat protein
LVEKLRDRYRILRPIGQGGFGRSYLAIDEDRLQQPCAIKQFSPQVYGNQTQNTRGLAKALELFAAEANRLHELGEHPQIPELHAYFAEGNQLYLVQQFVQGLTLTQAVAQQGLFDEARLRSLLLDLLPVLHFVHERQVVHRDIKPDNILLPSDGKKPFLIDFGVAKQVLGATAAQGGGTKVGTEGYAPLEQLRSGHAYPASDLYSLGVTCLYVLVGEPPDRLYDPLRDRWMWRDQLSLLGRDLSEALGGVLDQMICDRVMDRYQSAQAVLMDLTTERSPHAAAPTAAAPAATWRCVHTLHEHRDRVQALAFTAGGKQLLSAGGDRVIKLWDIVEGTVIRELGGHTSSINEIAVTADGRTLISGSRDCSVRLWDLPTGELRQVLTHHKDWVNTVAVSRDSRLLASAGDDHKIAIAAVPTGKLLACFKAHTRPIHAVAFDPSGKYLASGCDDGVIQIWNLATGRRVRSLSHHVGRISTLVFTPDGQLLISGSHDKTIKFWQLGPVLKESTPEGTQPRDPHAHSVAPVPVANPAQAANSVHAGRSASESQRGDRPQYTLSDHADAVFSLAVSADGRWLVSGSEDCTVKLWSLAERQLLQTFREQSWWVNAVAIAPQGTTVASGSGDRTICIWRLQV